jgi:glycosyltransferase involved in cell wall biosynthesis
MKIAFFTPTHAQSAIGRVTALVRTSLQLAGHNVALIATEQHILDPADVNPRLADCTPWTDVGAVRRIVTESDIIFHQIGDHYAFHAGSVAWLSEVGGCVALHDFFLGDMFLSWLPGNEAHAESILKRWYDLPLDEYLRMARSGRFVDRTWPRYPLTEWICSQADAVIAHSDFGLPAVRISSDVPVRVVSLPYDLADSFDVNDGSLPLRDPADDSVRLLTFGRINPNKLCDLIITSIAGDSELRSRMEYRIVGTILPTDSAYLTSLAHALGVKLAIIGEVNNAQLVAELHAADVIACLREPALESGSASAIEGMLSSTPLIVIDTGFYSCLPRESVFHVAQLDAQTGLTRVLRSIVDGDHDLLAMGVSAKAYADATFRADMYASAIIAVGIEAAKRRPEREIDNAFAPIYASWGATAQSKPIGDYIDDTAIFRA